MKNTNKRGKKLIKWLQTIWDKNVQKYNFVLFVGNFDYLIYQGFDKVLH